MSVYDPIHDPQPGDRVEMREVRSKMGTAWRLILCREGELVVYLTNARSGMFESFRRRECSLRQWRKATIGKADPIEPMPKDKLGEWKRRYAYPKRRTGRYG